jgi:predicted nucleic acid-binding protein
VPALFDTGALELLRRRDRRVEALALKLYPPVVCTQVLGEYLHAQFQTQATAATVIAARLFLAPFEVLVPTARTADHYAELRAELAAQGAELPDLSCWIAAHSLEHDIPLITTDQAFRRLPGLQARFIAVKKEPSGRTAGLPAGVSRENDQAGGRASSSALALLVLHWARDYLAETSALMESLGNATGTMG